MAPPLFLERGSRGKFVRAFQAGLNVRRQFHPLHDVLPPLAEDAVMGPATIARATLLLEKPGAIRFSRADLGEAGVNIALLGDLSGHNEGGNKRPVDVDRMAHDGVGGCWWKLTEGRSYINTEARRQIDEAGSVMLRGGYHFGDPSADRTGSDITALLDDARIEAEHYLRIRADVFGGSGPELPDVLDFERGIGSRLKGLALAAFQIGQPKRHEMNARWMLAWLEHVTRRTGRRPWWYTSRVAVWAHLRLAPPELLAELAKYDHWLASYNSGVEPARPLRPPFGRCKAWQFTGSGSVDGVDGRCDLSWALADDLRG